MENEEKGTVCVTGGTGYLASWLIMKLLQHGYSVRATVRSHPPGHQKDTISFLTSLPGAAQKLRLFHASLDEPDSFEPAVQGCVGVFHVAHPIVLEGDEMDEKLNERVIGGTLGILRACAKSKTVRRVVYTSSSSAVAWNAEEPEDAVLNENAWSDIGFIKASKFFGTPYFISKILTERAALDFAESHGLDLVSVIPPIIMGPFLCPRVPDSVSIALSMVSGREEVYGEMMKSSMVHIDDVASAHIFLFEHPHAKGRYICSALDFTIQELSEFLCAKYPEFPIPKPESLKDFSGYKQKSLSSKKLLDCGFEFKNGLDEMFDGAIQSCKQKGFL